MGSRLSHLECSRCGREHPVDRVHQRCDCGGALVARYDLTDLELSDVRARPGGLWRYEELLPVAGERVSLGEPETPLIFCPRLSERWGVETYIKDDSRLPTGTFKARGAAVGLSRALELGIKQVVMPTAGNAGAAWAAYAAAAGVALTVVMPKSAPRAAQWEVTTAGAVLELVDGTLTDAVARSRDIANDTGAFLAATFSEPYRLEGKKTCWLEVFDELGAPGEKMALPRTIVVPIGGGVAALAAAKAVKEARALGWVDGDGPMIVGVQAAGCAPIARAFERGDIDVAPWDADVSTIAAGIAVPAPSEGALVLDRVRDSGGSMLSVTDDAMVASMRELASSEGIFACPEGAAAVAATARLAGERALEGPVVIYNTGAGTKYLDELARFEPVVRS